MLDVEVFGAAPVPNAPPRGVVERLCSAAAAHAGVRDGHVAIEYVDAARIAELNLEHRGQGDPTDVLSFPIDGVLRADGGPDERDGRPAGRQRRHAPATPLELGDIVICPEHTADLREAIVHGMLHLLGMDHETDDGEMLALQRALLAGPT
jgi:probable rRNA maturation factor